ncbi:MAG: transporter substrate-binding domain-containing protein [Alcanivoracaceae bacterium]|nr:transporter substrate-binding domain-containing protein [Alcanivoracaceae bacterium]
MRPPSDRILAGLAASLLLVAAPVHAETLRLRADHWYPFNATPGDANPGFTIEVLEQIFSADHVALDYQLTSWSRALEQAHGGEADCVVGAYREEAPGLLFPRQHFAVDVPTFYVLAGEAWRYEGEASLDGKLVGVIADYSYGEKFDAWMKAHPRQVNVASGYRPLLNNVRMLLAGRVDVLVETPVVMDALLAEHGLNDALREAGAEASGDGRLYLACTNSPRGRLFTERFDAGWERLRASGALAEIYGRYGVTPP